ncbi:RNA methyltransferase [uncultured Croceitalea sp.]|uniref:TrmH family RNA methyltransferase n=1 Tax=uncultured Croceitalea sp. TaxID=1798908 RepID=UPI0033069202
MVSKNQLKLIKSLHQKKYRNEHGLFFVEGLKAVKELLNSDISLFKVFSTNPISTEFNDIEHEEIEEVDLKKISALHRPNGVLGVFKTPKPKRIDFDDWVVVLDDIRDPGNMGTIIRLCDWFGIKNLVCSKENVDCYNPKVLQATMGSIARVNISYTNLEDFITMTPLPIYGTFMNGDSIYSAELPKAGILIIGNEGNGISPKIEELIEKRVTIPQFGSPSTESLNAATATAIVLGEIRSRG